MSDDNSERGAHDRAAGSGEEEYEIAYLMKTHGITRRRAQEMIRDFEGDRQKIALALSAG